MKAEWLYQTKYKYKEQNLSFISAKANRKSVYGIQKDGNDDPVCKTAKKTQMCITDFWTQRGRGRGWDDLGEWH